MVYSLEDGHIDLFFSVTWSCVSLPRSTDSKITVISKNKIILYNNQFHRFNPYPAKLNYLNFQPLEVVPRYRDAQLQVSENYSYLFNLTPNIFKSWCLNTYFIPNNCDLIGL